MSTTFFGLPQKPSRAFGDGTHPTTQMCARAVDYLCRARVISALLDVGTGAGILARIARARGVDFVVGTDVDASALAAARENDALDQHSVPIEWSAQGPDAWGARFDVVVANILEAPLRLLRPALCAAVAPGGSLLLSGFLAAQVPALKQTFGWPGESTMLDGWALLSLRAPA